MAALLPVGVNPRFDPTAGTAERSLLRSPRLKPRLLLRPLLRLAP